MKKEKGVMMAAKGLLSLYQGVGAELLKRRDRERDAALNLREGGHKKPPAKRMEQKTRASPGLK